MCKKLVSFLLALTLMMGICIPASAAGGSFSDVTSDKWYYQYVKKAADLGLVNGVGGGNYAPDKQVTYAEFATMLTGINWADEVKATQTHPTDPWWLAKVIVADDHGLFAGTPLYDEYEWYDWANKPVSRSDMAMMTYNYMLACGGKEIDDKALSLTAARISDIGNEDKQHTKAIAYCYAEGILNGTGGSKFSPETNMNRAQAATVLCSIYAKVTGDVTGSGNQTQTPPATTKPAARPAGAVGGQYDLSKYTVPADTNKDGWITSDEVQAVLDRLKKEYPEGSEWGKSSRYPGLYEYSGGAISGGLGAGAQCVGFAYLISDQIFGNLPKYEVSIEETRVGDYMRDGPANHSSIVTNDYGKYISPINGKPYADAYGTVDGNTNGRHVIWSMVSRYSEWPTGAAKTYIWSRYPVEDKLTDSGNQTGEPPTTTKSAAHPAGAVGGQYDLAKYTVPADTNKDGWITSDEVQAKLDELKKQYPNGTEWGEKSRYPGLYEYSDGTISGGLGAGSACSGFARLVSDQIFGNLPKYEVSIERIRVGDYMVNGSARHDCIALCGVGECEWDPYATPTMYKTADGNVGGIVAWGRSRYSDDWPTGASGTCIWSRYPQE